MKTKFTHLYLGGVFGLLIHRQVGSSPQDFLISLSHSQNLTPGIIIPNFYEQFL